jgi:hypothetical protein
MSMRFPGTSNFATSSLRTMGRRPGKWRKLRRCGESDPWCSPRCSEEIARLIPHARLKLYQNSSHFFLNEHFDQVMAHRRKANS